MTKIKFHSKYNTVDKNGKGIVMFRYSVSGSAEEINQYKAAQGDYYRENEEGTPLYFTPNYVGDNGSLGITAKGKVYADTSAFDKLNSMVSRYPGVLGQEIAKLGAAQLLGSLLNSGASASGAAVSQNEVMNAGKLDA